MPVFNKIGAVCALTALLTVGCSTVSKTVSDTAHALTTMHTKKVVDVNVESTPSTLISTFTLPNHGDEPDRGSVNQCN